MSNTEINLSTYFSTLFTIQTQTNKNTSQIMDTLISPLVSPAHMPIISKILNIALITKDNSSYSITSQASFNNSKISIKIINSIISIIKTREKLASKPDNKLQQHTDTLCFDYIYLSNYLVTILTIQANEQHLITISNHDMHIQWSRLYTWFYYFSWSNYISSSIQTHWKHWKTQVSSLSFFYNELLLIPLFSHFEMCLDAIVKRQEVHISSLQYKTSYVLNLKNDEVWFDISTLQKHLFNSNGASEDHCWKEKTKIISEILYHSHNLQNEYDKEHNSYSFDPFFAAKFIMRLECRSTYPRLIFIIKFIPVLQGISLIHIYHQNKLSHFVEMMNTNTTNNNSTNHLDNIISMKTNYKEFEVIYGTDVNKQETQFEWKYNDPWKLKKIEQFLIDFFIWVNPQARRSTSMKYKIYQTNKYLLKYFDDSFTYPICSIVNSSNINTINWIYDNLLQRLKTLYMKQYQDWMLNEQNMSDRPINSKSSAETNTMNYKDFLYLTSKKFWTYFKNNYAEEAVSPIYLLNLNITSIMNSSEYNKQMNYCQNNDDWSSINWTIIDQKPKVSSDISFDFNGGDISVINHVEGKCNLVECTGNQGKNAKESSRNYSGYVANVENDKNDFSFWWEELQEDRPLRKSSTKKSKKEEK